MLMLFIAICYYSAYNSLQAFLFSFNVFICTSSSP